MIVIKTILLLDHAIVGVLQDESDPLLKVLRVEKAPTESYADIGGLENQIQEIKVFVKYNTLGSCRVTFNTSRVI